MSGACGRGFQNRPMAAGLVLLVCVLWPPTLTIGQQPIPADQWRQGFHGFNLIAQGAGLELMSEADWQATPSDQRVLIALGQTRDIPRDLYALHQQGVPICIATETNDRDRFRQFGLAVTPMRGPVISASDVYRHADCPIVRDLREHPVFGGVQSLVCNRPAKLLSFQTQPLVGLARLPTTAGRQIQTLIAEIDTADRGRFLFVADSSLFSNQMLLAGDNARFADQVCRWLAGSGQRRALLLLVDGQPQAAVDPGAIRTLPPPPTRKQVLDALKSLPPEALLEFGNSVATVLEDENMVNEFLQATEDRIPPRAVDRFFLLLVFAMVCTTGLVTYLWQKRMLRRTATDVTARRQRFFSQRQKQQQAHERQVAARALLNSLSLAWGNRRLEDWPDFPQGLQLAAADPTGRLDKIREAYQNLHREGKLYWTPERLAELQQLVRRCGQELELAPRAIESLPPMG